MGVGGGGGCGGVGWGWTDETTIYITNNFFISNMTLKGRIVSLPTHENKVASLTNIRTEDSSVKQPHNY